jgi:hypothetical protein
MIERVHSHEILRRHVRASHFDRKATQRHSENTHLVCTCTCSPHWCHVRVEHDPKGRCAPATADSHTTPIDIALAARAVPSSTLGHRGMLWTATGGVQGRVLLERIPSLQLTRKCWTSWSRPVSARSSCFVLWRRARGSLVSSRMQVLATASTCHETSGEAQVCTCACASSVHTWQVYGVTRVAQRLAWQLRRVYSAGVVRQCI